jgi:hypothetical protein
MGYTMKRGNKKISYQDILSESNQDMTDAIEAERRANVEEEKANSPTDFKKQLEAGTDRVTPNSTTLKYSSPNKMDPATISMLMKVKDMKGEKDGDKEEKDTGMIDMTRGL